MGEIPKCVFQVCPAGHALRQSPVYATLYLVIGKQDLSEGQ